MEPKLQITEKTGSDKGALLLQTYTGIEPVQFGGLTPKSQQKVLSGLYKQLDIAASLHGPSAKEGLNNSLFTYFSDPYRSILDSAQQINSLMVYGDVRPLSGTGVEHLHERVSHFWRILGWEELMQIEDGSTKLAAGSIDEVVRSAGNLIRTLDLLAEQWAEHGIGQELIYPFGEKNVTRESTNGYSYVKISGPHTQTVAVVCSAEEKIPTTEDKEFFGAQSNLLRRLLDRYPMEFAFTIYDYFLFTQGLDSKKLNVAILQEYKKNGQLHVKAIMNGQWAVLRGGVEAEGYSQELAVASNAGPAMGQPDSSDFVLQDFTVNENHLVTIVHGRIANAIAESSDGLSAIGVNPIHGDLKKQIIQYGKVKDKFRRGVPTAQQGKPIISFTAKPVSEYKPVEVTQERLTEIADETCSYLISHGVQFVNLEAAHIHADTVPTKRQKQGMIIGTHMSKFLEDRGVSIRRTTMIDEDHVPNSLDHKGYVSLMHKHGFDVDDVLYESSPAIREIAISAIVTLQQTFPDRLHMEGNALVFDIPNSDLRVELVKDVSSPVIELGCVIFDLGLTLAKVHPELSDVYMEGGTDKLHKAMLDIYSNISGLKERRDAVKNAFPEKTKTFEDIAKAVPLPPILNGHSAIINILEGFYSAQQTKLRAMLKALNIPIELIDVTFSDQGVSLSLPEKEN